MTRNQWEIITTLMRLSNTVEPILVKHLNSYGVGLTDLRLLIMIRLHGGISQKRLAAKTGLSQGVVSSRLDRMEHSGSITRNHVGRRLVAVELTEAGVELLAVIMNSFDSSPPLSALNGLAVEEEDSLVKGLRRLVQVLGHPIEAGAGDPSQPSFVAPITVVEQQLNRSREALDEALEANDYQLTDSVRRLGDELDDLVRAYIILSKGQNGSAEGG